MQISSLTVTIIIPMRNEEHHIGRCLDSLAANSFPEDELEILVIDGTSNDQSHMIVEEYAHRWHCIRLLDNPAKIVSAALNIGLSKARGSVIIIIGAHAVYPSDYIRTCLSELERTHADVVGGRLITLAGADTLIARGIALMTQHAFGVGTSAFRTGSTGEFVDTVPYGAYRRQVFEQVGTFNEKLTRNQDFELNARVRAAGGRLFLSPALAVTYYNVPNFMRLLTQAWGNGRWLARMWVAAPHSFHWRHAVPMAFVTVLLVSVALTTVAPAFVIVAGAIGLLYGSATIVSSVQIAVANGWKFCLPLIGLFFAHHVAYGLGTIAGITAIGAHHITGTNGRVRIHLREAAKRTNVSRYRSSPE